MSDSASRSGPSPGRSDVIPETYAIHVTDRRIDVWQYRVGIPHPDGAWQFVESLDREDDPKLSMDHATLTPPTTDGYWVYSRSYDCELDCD